MAKRNTKTDAVGENTASVNARKIARAKKKLAVMDLIEDFLFGVVVTYPGIGERFVRILLRIIFGKDFSRISVTAQKPLFGEDSDKRGARLDIYVEPEPDSGGHVTVYDVEPDRNDKPMEIAALPRRMRFYHGKIIARELGAGADFEKLKNVVILMIMSYDPFGLGRMIYTIENGCKEVPEMPYGDGASTVFLYAGGTVGVSNEEVRQLLGYMVKSTAENAVNDDLKEIHGMVETVKDDPETSLEYWKWKDRQIRMQREAEAQGMAKGMAVGEMKQLIFLVCKKISKNKTLERIAEELEEEVFAIEPIYNIAKESAPDYEVDKIYARLMALHLESMPCKR